MEDEKKVHEEMAKAIYKDIDWEAEAIYQKMVAKRVELKKKLIEAEMAEQTKKTWKKRKEQENNNQ